MQSPLLNLSGLIEEKQKYSLGLMVSLMCKKKRSAIEILHMLFSLGEQLHVAGLCSQNSWRSCSSFTIKIIFSKWFNFCISGHHTEQFSFSAFEKSTGSCCG